MPKSLLAGIAGALVLSTPAHAVQVCAWIDETVGDNAYHELKLWLEADAEFEGYYKLAGQGLAGDGMKAHSPGGGTFFLRPKQADSFWGFGSTLYPPGTIDVIVEIRAKPADVFSDEPPPLLASFTFHRDVPEGETAAPGTFAARQCATLEPARIGWNHRDRLHPFGPERVPGAKPAYTFAQRALRNPR